MHMNPLGFMLVICIGAPIAGMLAGLVLGVLGWMTCAPGFESCWR